MGIVRMGPPTEIVLLLAQWFKLDTFVETGTFLGDTARWAAQRFDKVVTIENSRTLYDQAVAKTENVSNIEFLFGNSRDELKKIISQLSGPAFFWLDSHWCGGDSYGQNDQCPLLDELDIINKSRVEHFICIDDARLFLSPPPAPNLIDCWPTISEIIEVLMRENSERYIIILEDVIIAVPSHARSRFAALCQEINTIAWHQYGHGIVQERRPHMIRGTEQIIQGVKTILTGLLLALRRTVEK